MKNTLRTLACLGVFVVSLLLATSAHAQQHVAWLVGPEGGYNFVMYKSVAFPVLNDHPNFYFAQNGKGNGYFCGLSGEDPLDANMHNFLIVEAGFDSKPGTFFIHSNDAFR
ncbi:MAG TPA: hypothetical protein VFX22_04775, partial [Candidatus Kapabacteria bacterium]|nr:hypothetical protein [Candidatus Kapabacteria bacterium]